MLDSLDESDSGCTRGFQTSGKGIGIGQNAEGATELLKAPNDVATSGVAGPKDCLGGFARSASNWRIHE